MVLLQSSVAVSLVVLGLSLVSGQQLAGVRLGPHGDTTGIDLTNRIVSFEDFGIGTGSPPAFQCFITPSGNNWYDPTGTALFPGRVGTSPGFNEIFLQGISPLGGEHGVLLHRGANYYELDGLWCCGPQGGRNLNTNRCVTFTPCPTLPVLTNGVITYNRDTNVATYSCDSGYRLEGNEGSTIRTCSGTTTSAGIWSGSQPSCVAGCTDLPILTNGFISYDMGTSSPRPSGTVATYSCLTGYLLTGAMTRICHQTDGTWSGTAPTCRAICPDLLNPMNGMIFFNMDASYGGRLEGTVATYSCDTGYAVEDANTRTCMNDGTWNGRDIACIASCYRLTLSNGMVSLSNDDFPILAGVVATHSCSDGYQLSGYEIRTCESQPTGGGVWNGTDVTCYAICPNVPSITNVGLVSYNPATTPRLEGTTVTYSCALGLLLEGEATRTCQNNRTWSGDEPYCQRVFLQLGSQANSPITTNNTVISISEIGAGSSGLVCRTDSTSCCDPSTASWVYNGLSIPSANYAGDFYTDYGAGYVSLNKRNNETTATGIYCCVVPTNGDMEISFCVDIRQTGQGSLIVDVAGLTIAIVSILLVVFAILSITLLVIVIIRTIQLKQARLELSHIHLNSQQQSEVVYETPDNFKDVSKMDMELKHCPAYGFTAHSPTVTTRACV